VRIAISYPEDREKITTWPREKLKEISFLILMESAMDKRQGKLFRAGPNWEQNPTLIMRDRTGIDKAICSWESHKRRHSLSRLAGFSDSRRGHIRQLDVEVLYPDDSVELKSYKENWLQETERLIFFPLTDIATSGDWKENPAFIRCLPGGILEGMCAKIGIPPKVPALPSDIDLGADCGFERIGLPITS
jgi:hypothetical protein